MVLHGLDRQGFVADAFDGTVVHAAVGHYDGVRKAFIGNGVAVVLAGNVHPSGAQVLHRMVGAAMAEGQLEGVI